MKLRVRLKGFEKGALVGSMLVSGLELLKCKLMKEVVKRV